MLELGEYIEETTVHKSDDLLKELSKPNVEDAWVEKKVDGKITEILIKSKDIQIGDVVVVGIGNTIPVDGHILEGNASVNEVSMTGEGGCDELWGLIEIEECELGNILFVVDKLSAVCSWLAVDTEFIVEVPSEIEEVVDSEFVWVTVSDVITLVEIVFIVELVWDVATNDLVVIEIGVVPVTVEDFPEVISAVVNTVGEPVATERLENIEFGEVWGYVDSDSNSDVACDSVCLFVELKVDSGNNDELGDDDWMVEVNGNNVDPLITLVLVLFTEEELVEYIGVG